METPDPKTILQKSGIKPSLHRMKILEYLIANKNHPTVDMVYNDISGEIPTLSKTTIYNTLKTLLKFSLVQAITIEDNEVRFDAELKPHAHFKCTRCGRLYDIDVSREVFSLKSISGHHITETQLYFKGLCKHCKD